MKTKEHKENIIKLMLQALDRGDINLYNEIKSDYGVVESYSLDDDKNISISLSTI